MSLSLQDRNSATWAVLKRHLEARLDTLRRMNDNPSGEMETATLRGRIAEIKRLLAMDKDDEAEG